MGYLLLFNELLDSNYYKWVLSPYDQRVLQTLYRKVLVHNSRHYNGGALVVNIKLKTLALDIGMRYSTLRDSMTKLDYLGVIIKLEKKAKNNRYFIGFRLQNNKRLYLIDHLIPTYKEFLDKSIETQIEECRNSKLTPVINDLSSYRIKDAYREFIIDHCDKLNELINKRVKDNKTIFELLFNCRDVYRKSLPKEAVLKL